MKGNKIYPCGSDSLGPRKPIMSIAGELGKTSVEMFTVGCEFVNNVHRIRDFNCVQGDNSNMSVGLDAERALEEKG